MHRPSEPPPGQEPSPEPPSARISLPLWAALGLGSLTLASLLLVAFLLGRETARTLPPDRAETLGGRAGALGEGGGAGGGRDGPEALALVSPSEGRSPSPSAPPPSPRAPGARLAIKAPPPPPDRAGAGARAAKGGGVAPREGASASAVEAGRPGRARPRPAPSQGAAAGQGASTLGVEAEPVRAAAGQEAVSRYMGELNASLGAASAWQGGEALAREILGQGAAGDGSGFARLLEVQRAALARVRQVRPPASCREHHRATLALLEQGIGLMERLSQATLSGETSALFALAAEGQALQARVERLQTLERQLLSGSAP